MIDRWISLGSMLIQFDWDDEATILVWLSPLPALRPNSARNVYFITPRPGLLLQSAFGYDHLYSQTVTLYKIGGSPQVVRFAPKLWAVDSG
jgi:hypothetical protein